jgi:glutamate racemase
MIGVFDSGVGGLTVVKEIFKYLPNYQIIYFGDTARLPYGTKGANFVIRYSEKITKWLLSHKAKVIVVACHTSSAIASDSLKKKFKNIPIFEMMTPTVKEILKGKRKRIGIIGTPGTIKSRSYEKKLKKANKNIKIFSVSCPLFVPLVEEGLVKGKIAEEIVKKYLLPLKKKNIDTLVLACTHYPLLKSTIKKIMGSKVKIINPAQVLAKELKDNISSAKKGRKHFFFFSDEPYHFEKISHLCFKKKIKIKVKDPFTY